MSDITDRYSRGRAGKSGLGWLVLLAAVSKSVTIIVTIILDTWRFLHIFTTNSYVPKSMFYYVNTVTNILQAAFEHLLQTAPTPSTTLKNSVCESACACVPVCT